MAKIFIKTLTFCAATVALCVLQPLSVSAQDGLAAQVGTGIENNVPSTAYGIAENDGTPPPTTTLAVLEGRYITLRGNAAGSLTFGWAAPNNTDNIKLVVRRNNQIVATRFLSATDNVATLTGLSFNDGDVLHATITMRTQALQLRATYKTSLQNGQRAQGVGATQPLATVESVHPRRRTRQRSASNAPQINCAWVTNAELNDKIYYKTSDVGACFDDPNADSLTIYTCLAAHTAYFTNDDQVYACGATNGGGETLGTQSARRTITATPSPNPFVADFDLSFRLPEDAATLQLQVVDMAGRTVYRQTQAQILAGNYSINIPTADLPKGVYGYILTTDTVVAQGRVLKID